MLDNGKYMQRKKKGKGIRRAEGWNFITGKV